MPTFERLQDKFGDTLDVQTDGDNVPVSFRFNIVPGGIPYICLDTEEAVKLRDILIKRLPLDKE